MAERKPELGQIVRDTVAKFPDASTKSLARKLYDQYPDWFSSLEAARRRVRYYRGASGKRDRAAATDKELHQPHRDQTKPDLPPSQAEPWLPFVMASKRCLILSDAHIPYHAELPIRKAVEYGKQEEVDTVLLNGDWFDFYTISRWQKHPGKRDLLKEIDAGKASLEWLRHEFPKAAMIFKAGNHEERWNAYIWTKAAELWDLPQCQLPEILGLADYGIEYVADQRPILFGSDKVDEALPVFHGHELPRGLTNPVNMARGAFLRAIHTMLCGHGHRTSQHTETTLFRSEITCWSTGCLCDVSPEYARINKWNWGFAGAFVVDGGWSVDNKRVSKAGDVW